MSSEERLDALRHLATQTRQAIAELLSTAAPDAAIEEAAAHVARATELLAGQPHGRPYEGVAESALSGDPRAFADYSPFVGLVNPLAPPLTAEVVDDHIAARVTYDDQYEGPPGCVHGGFIAAGFDEVLGFAQSLSGAAGMTGRLEVSYRQPTPLHRELIYRGRVERVSGRKILTTGTLHDGDVLTAEAQALFVTLKSGVLERLMVARGPHLPG